MDFLLKDDLHITELTKDTRKRMNKRKGKYEQTTIIQICLAPAVDFLGKATSTYAHHPIY